MQQAHTPGKRIAVFDVENGYPVGSARVGEIVDVREDGQLVVQFDHASGWALIHATSAHIVTMTGSTTDPYAITGEVIDEDEDGVVVRFPAVPFVARRADGIVEMVPRSDSAFERHVTRKSMLLAIEGIVDEETRDLLRRTVPGIAAEAMEDAALESALHGVNGEGLS